MAHSCHGILWGSIKKRGEICGLLWKNISYILLGEEGKFHAYLFFVIQLINTCSHLENNTMYLMQNGKKYYRNAHKNVIWWGQYSVLR